MVEARRAAERMASMNSSFCRHFPAVFDIKWMALQDWHSKRSRRQPTADWYFLQKGVEYIGVWMQKLCVCGIPGRDCSSVSVKLGPPFKLGS